MVMGLDEMRQLLFPCHEFDHARGFAFLSRKLTYGMADHITEHNPTVHNHLHLEGNVIGEWAFFCSVPVSNCSNRFN
jgi:hypothetical protein